MSEEGISSTQLSHGNVREKKNAFVYQEKAFPKKITPAPLDS